MQPAQSKDDPNRADDVISIIAATMEPDARSLCSLFIAGDRGTVFGGADARAQGFSQGRIAATDYGGKCHCFITQPCSPLSCF